MMNDPPRTSSRTERTSTASVGLCEQTQYNPQPLYISLEQAHSQMPDRYAGDKLDVHYPNADTAELEPFVRSGVAHDDSGEHTADSQSDSRAKD